MRFHASVVTVVGILLALLVAPGVSRAEVPVQDQASLGRAAIEQKYAQLGGQSGLLGAPSESQATCAGWIAPGCVQEYANGRIIWSAATGARAVTRPDRTSTRSGPTFGATATRACGASRSGSRSVTPSAG